MASIRRSTLRVVSDPLPSARARVRTRQITKPRTRSCVHPVDGMHVPAHREVAAVGEDDASGADDVVLLAEPRVVGIVAGRQLEPPDGRLHLRHVAGETRAVRCCEQEIVVRLLGRRAAGLDEAAQIVAGVGGAVVDQGLELTLDVLIELPADRLAEREVDHREEDGHGDREDQRMEGGEAEARAAQQVSRAHGSCSRRRGSCGGAPRRSPGRSCF